MPQIIDITEKPYIVLNIHELLVAGDSGILNQ